jgi:hypothetical protein
MAHKIPEALASEANGTTVAGEVEVDGACFGGHVRPANYKANRRDCRLAENQIGKRRVVVIMRERGGQTLPFVFKSEDASVVTIARAVAPGNTVFADEATHWDCPACSLSDQAHQSFRSAFNRRSQYQSGFSRLRRAEIGIHHMLLGRLSAYAREMAWHENNRSRQQGRTKFYGDGRSIAASGIATVEGLLAAI